MTVFFLSGRLERSSCSDCTTLPLVVQDSAPATTSTVFQAKCQSVIDGAVRSCIKGDRGWWLHLRIIFPPLVVPISVHPSRSSASIQPCDSLLSCQQNPCPLASSNLGSLLPIFAVPPLEMCKLSQSDSFKTSNISAAEFRGVTIHTRNATVRFSHGSVCITVFGPC